MLRNRTEPCKRGLSSATTWKLTKPISYERSKYVPKLWFQTSDQDDLNRPKWEQSVLSYNGFQVSLNLFTILDIIGLYSKVFIILQAKPFFANYGNLNHFQEVWLASFYYTQPRIVTWVGTWHCMSLIFGVKWLAEKTLWLGTGGAQTSVFASIVWRNFVKCEMSWKKCT